MKTTKLQKITEKYCCVEYEDNYYVGGGLDCGKFASNRHEHAMNDKGKLTFGKASLMFKNATGLDISFVKEVIKYAVPNMEWHHAGLLPKSYGGGMKKTYFLNASEICNIASKWDEYVSKLQIQKKEQRDNENEAKSRDAERLEFLEKHAEKVSRISEIPEYFYETDREMNGKYGWFSSYGKSYNLPEYYTGWKFNKECDYNKFMQI